MMPKLGFRPGNATLPAPAGSPPKSRLPELKPLAAKSPITAGRWVYGENGSANAAASSGPRGSVGQPPIAALIVATPQNPSVFQIAPCAPAISRKPASPSLLLP